MVDIAAGWEMRVKPGAYVSPSGTRIEFQAEDVSRETELRRQAFEFPDVDGVYIQDNGRGATKYPLRCFFSGARCDLEASAFEVALMEPGIGRIEHPFYGTFYVVPMGTIKRLDALATAANQSIVEVEFWPTLRTVYPTVQLHPESEIKSWLGYFSVEASQQFTECVSLKDSTSRAAMAAGLRNAQKDVSDLKDATTADPETCREWEDSWSSLGNSADVLSADSSALASAVVTLTLLPSTASVSISARLTAYVGLFATLAASEAGNPADALLPSMLLGDRGRNVANAFYLTDLIAQSAVAGAAQACIEHTFTTRPEAIEAAATVSALLDSVVAWRDGCFASLAALGPEHIDRGASDQALQQLVALTSGYLVQTSFTLLPERRIILDRARTIIDLAAELYGEIDTKLDDLIAHNDLTGDEILELPMGREIRYYVAA